jgi:hypothetical protein
MLCNIRLNQTTSIDILEYYNSIFIKRAQPILVLIKAEEECENRIKKRKFSVPDALIRRIQFESESAFDTDVVFYEPLMKTIFNNNQSLLNSNNRPLMNLSNKYVSYSTKCSPLISRTAQSPGGMNHTPRTNRVRDLYTDYNEVVPFQNSANSNSGSTGSNVHKNKLKALLSSGRVNRASLSSISESSGNDQNQSNRTNQTNQNIPNDLRSVSNSLNFDNVEGVNLTPSQQSQTTPEFNKVKK